MRALAGSLTSRTCNPLLAAANLSVYVLQVPALWGLLFWSVQKQQP